MKRVWSRSALGLMLTAGISACAVSSDPNAGPHTQQDEAPSSPDLTITIDPHSGPPGSEVHVTASGFEPSTPAVVGMGPPRSEYRVIGYAEVDQQGRVETRVRVPEWARPGLAYLFVVADPEAVRKAISGEFQVTAPEHDRDPINQDPISNP